MASEWLRRVWYLVNRRRFDDALKREMESHRETMNDPRQFGNGVRLREDARDVWGWRWLDDLAQDLRYTARSLAGHKMFTAGVLLTLALGIGATTAVFSVVSGLVLRPLPFADPDRIVRLFGTSANDPAATGRGPVFAFHAYEEGTTSFDAITGCEVSAAFLRGDDGAERVMTVRTAGNFFGVLGVPAMRGRTYEPSDGAGVAVASEGFWRRRFNADPAAIGTIVALDGRSVRLVGVMPEAFQYPYGAASLLSGAAGETRTDLWLPFEQQLVGPRSRLGTATARLKPGVSLPAAQADVARISAALEAESPANNAGRGVRIEPLSSVVVGRPLRRVLYMLFGAVALLMALACANVMNLSLARMTLRAKEVAVRSALGAGRRRLVRQFVTESLALSIAGGSAGLAIAWWGTQELLRRAAATIPRAHEVGLDWRVFLFLAAVCTATGLVVGLLPAVLAGRRDVQADLQSAGGRGTIGLAQRRVRDALVVAEVAIAFVLAVGAAVLVRELAHLRSTDPGMVTANVLTFHVGGRRTAEIEPREFYEIADRVAGLPGVRAAGFTQLLPLQSWGWTSNSVDFFVKGRPPISTPFAIHMRYVTPGYFDALRIPIERGRGFTANDTARGEPVILINSALAKRQFGDEDPVGQTMNRGTIVGIVKDFRQATLGEPAFPELYFPVAQNWSQIADLGMTLVVGTTGRPEAFVDRIRSAIRDAGPRHVIFNVKTMDEVVSDSLATFTMYLALVTAFAVLAVVLALSGTYGVIAYVAGARRKEFAIRVALGADRPHVTRLVVLQGVVLTAIGLAAGYAAVHAMTPLLGGLPVTVRPPDVITIAPVAAFIAVIATVACLVPALRAARVNPTEALRNE